MKLLDSLNSINVDEYNLTQELQFSKFIMELFSYTFTFKLTVNPQPNAGNFNKSVAILRKGKSPTPVSKEEFIYYIQVVVDRMINEKVLRLNGKVIDEEIKRAVYLNTKKDYKMSVPKEYIEDVDKQERYNYYHRIVVSYLRAHEAGIGGLKNSSHLENIYGCKYGEINEDNFNDNIESYKNDLVQYNFLIDLFDNLVLVQNMYTLLNNMAIYLNGLNIKWDRGKV